LNKNVSAPWKIPKLRPYVSFKSTYFSTCSFPPLICEDYVKCAFIRICFCFSCPSDMTIF
jgi:hypothetical protein